MKVFDTALNFSTSLMAKLLVSFLLFGSFQSFVDCTDLRYSVTKAHLLKAINDNIKDHILKTKDSDSSISKIGRILDSCEKQDLDSVVSESDAKKCSSISTFHNHDSR